MKLYELYTHTKDRMHKRVRPGLKLLNCLPIMPIEGMQIVLHNAILCHDVLI